MNIIMADAQQVYVSSFYTGDPTYFQMAVKQGRATVVCSEPFPGDAGWQRLPNDSFHTFSALPRSHMRGAVALSRAGPR